MTPPLHTSPSPLERLHTTFERAADEANIADTALREFLQSAADADPLPSDLTETVKALHHTRSQAATALGLAVVRWMRLGGDVVLEDPPSTASPGPAKVNATAVVVEKSPSACALDGDTAAASRLHRGVPASLQPPIPSHAPASGCHGPQPHAALKACERTDARVEPSEEAPTAKPRSAVAGAADIARLIQGFGRTHSSMQEPRVAVQTSMPPSIPSRLGAPRQVRDATVWRQQLEGIEAEIQTCQDWSLLDNAPRRELLSMLVARARHLQDEVDIPAGEKERLKGVFQLLTRRMYERDVGYVNGLARHQRPSAGSWRAEETIWWSKVAGRAGVASEATPEEQLASLRSDLANGVEDADLVDRVERLVAAGISSRDARLVELVAPHAKAFEGSARCKTLKAVLKQRLQEEEDEEEAIDAAVAHVPDSILSRTRGQRAVLVGGDCRNRALQRIQDALQLSEVDWETGHKVRRLSALSERVKSGGVDIVVVFQRFVSHKVTDILLPSLKSQQSVELVWVPRGYGVSAMVQALDGTSASHSAP